MRIPIPPSEIIKSQEIMKLLDEFKALICKTDAIEELKKYVEDKKPDIDGILTYGYGYTPAYSVIEFAAFNSTVDTFRFLLEKSPNINAKSKNNLVDLIRYQTNLSREEKLKKVHILWTSGIYKKFEDETTELHMAAAAGDLKRTKSLVKEQPNRLLEANSKGKMALHRAIEMDHAVIINYLVQEAKEQKDYSQEFIKRLVNSLDYIDSWNWSDLHLDFLGRLILNSTDLKNSLMQSRVLLSCLLRFDRSIQLSRVGYVEKYRKHFELLIHYLKDMKPNQENKKDALIIIAFIHCLISRIFTNDSVCFTLSESLYYHAIQLSRHVDTFITAQQYLLLTDKQAKLAIYLPEKTKSCFNDVKILLQELKEIDYKQTLILTNETYSEYALRNLDNDQDWEKKFQTYIELGRDKSFVIRFSEGNEFHPDAIAGYEEIYQILLNMAKSDKFSQAEILIRLLSFYLHFPAYTEKFNQTFRKVADLLIGERFTTANLEKCEYLSACLAVTANNFFKSEKYAEANQFLNLSIQISNPAKIWLLIESYFALHKIYLKTRSIDQLETNTTKILELTASLKEGYKTHDVSSMLITIADNLYDAEIDQLAEHCYIFAIKFCNENKIGRLEYSLPKMYVCLYILQINPPTPKIEAARLTGEMILKITKDLTFDMNRWPECANLSNMLRSACDSAEPPFATAFFAKAFVIAPPYTRIPILIEAFSNQSYPLIKAALDAHFQSLKDLIKINADINGETLLSHALLANQPWLIKYLLLLDAQHPFQLNDGLTNLLKECEYALNENLSRVALTVINEGNCLDSIFGTLTVYDKNEKQGWQRESKFLPMDLREKIAIEALKLSDPDLKQIPNKLLLSAVKRKRETKIKIPSVIKFTVNYATQSFRDFPQGILDEILYKHVQDVLNISRITRIFLKQELEECFLIGTTKKTTITRESLNEAVVNVLYYEQQYELTLAQISHRISIGLSQKHGHSLLDGQQYQLGQKIGAVLATAFGYYPITEHVTTIANQILNLLTYKIDNRIREQEQHFQQSLASFFVSPTKNESKSPVVPSKKLPITMPVALSTKYSSKYQVIEKKDAVPLKLGIHIKDFVFINKVQITVDDKEIRESLKELIEKIKAEINAKSEHTHQVLITLNL